MVNLHLQTDVNFGSGHFSRFQIGIVIGEQVIQQPGFQLDEINILRNFKNETNDIQNNTKKFSTWYSIGPRRQSCPTLGGSQSHLSISINQCR